MCIGTFIAFLKIRVLGAHSSDSDPGSPEIQRLVQQVRPLFTHSSLNLGLAVLRGSMLCALPSVRVSGGGGSGREVQ